MGKCFIRHLESIRHWLARKSLGAMTDVDYTIKRGDLVVCRNWRHGPVEVADVNWALLAAGVYLRPGDPSTLVVWPVWGMRKRGIVDG